MEEFLILLKVLKESLSITALSIRLVLMRARAFEISTASAENIEQNLGSSHYFYIVIMVKTFENVKIYF